MRIHHNHAKRGFTLPEVVITSLLIMVLMVPLSRTVYLTVYSTQYARDTGTAVSLAQERLEALSDQPFDAITSGRETRDGFDVVWTVTGAGDTKTVNVTVSWRIVGREQEIDVNTVYTRGATGGYQF